MLALYSAALALALVAGAPWFLYQALRRQKYLGSLRERLGALPVSLNLDGEPSIWIHAVSVGEVLAARPLADELKVRYPGFRLFVSTTTSAGQQLAKRHLRDADAVFYFPMDFGVIVRRVLGRVRPRLLVLMEGEIWPNVLAECRRRGRSRAID
jgi:3-deoxy-D-manno-octulosonic-acid transferase